MAGFIRTHRDLTVYKTALEAALKAAKLARRFPSRERALIDQASRAARSPGACIAEAWRKRRYPAYWKNKLSDAQGEAAEAQYWFELAMREGYCTEGEFLGLFDNFEKLISQLSNMFGNTKSWTTEA